MDREKRIRKEQGKGGQERPARGEEARRPEGNRPPEGTEQPPTPAVAAELPARQQQLLQEMSDLSRRLAAVSDRAQQLIRSAEATARQLDAVQDVTEAVLSGLPLSDLLHELLGRLQRILAGDTATILLLTEDGQNLVVQASVGIEQRERQQVPVPLCHGIAGRIAATREPMIVEDLSRTEVITPILRRRIRSLVGAPLMVRDRVIGVVHVGTATTRHFTEDDLRLLQLVADRAASAIDHARAEEVRSQLAAIVESSEDAIIGETLDGIITSWNSGAERMYGYSAEETRGKPMLLIFPPERHQELESILHRLKQGERIAHYETVRVRKDGVRLDVSTGVSPIRDATGAIIGGATISRDITPRKRQEEERTRLLEAERQAAADAEGQRARLQTILESAPQGIIFVDAERGQLVVNPAAVRLSGHALDPDEGLAGYSKMVGHPDGRPLESGELPLSRALKGEAVWDEELSLRRPDGSRIPILSSAAPVRGARGQVVGAVVIFQDITARKELERMREEWTSMIAHDMRQPIAVITGYAGILRQLMEHRESPPEEPRALEHIQVAARNLNKTVSDLLDISRLEARRLRLEVRSLDLPDLIRGVVERNAPVTRGHPVEVEIEPGIPRVAGDPIRLEQVLANLLSNATKYGYPDREIRVRARRQNGEVVVSVRNEGRGIPAEDIPRLFNRFHRGSWVQEQRIAGLGLGLYISRGLVEAHGGRIWAESTPDRATTISFSLPIPGTAVRPN